MKNNDVFSQKLDNLFSGSPLLKVMLGGHLITPPPATPQLKPTEYSLEDGRLAL